MLFFFWFVAFELWCWRRLLRVPWTARRSNQSILKEISPGCALEGLMLKLKLQYFGHLMQRADSLEKTLMLGEIEGRRRRGRQRMRWLDGITNSMNMVWVGSGSWWQTGRPGVLRTWLRDWTELNWIGWVGGLGENGYMNVYGWVPSLFTWNLITLFVNRLYPNKKLKVFF